MVSYGNIRNLRINNPRFPTRKSYYMLIMIKKYWFERIDTLTFFNI